jgi:hypothetical protein
MSISAVIVIVSIIAVDAMCGERRGPVVGGGVGVALFAKTTPNEEKHHHYRFDHPSRFAIHLIFGYAINNDNMTVLQSDLVYTDLPLVQGFIGIAHYFYFGRSGKSPYLMGGAGLQYSSWSTGGFLDFETAFRFGPGLLIGSGYEFAHYVQIGMTMGYGKTTHNEIDFDHLRVCLDIFITAY